MSRIVLNFTSVTITTGEKVFRIINVEFLDFRGKKRCSGKKKFKFLIWKKYLEFIITYFCTVKKKSVMVIIFHIMNNINYIIM